MDCYPDLKMQISELPRVAGPVPDQYQEWTVCERFGNKEERTWTFSAAARGLQLARKAGDPQQCRRASGSRSIAVVSDGGRLCSPACPQSLDGWRPQSRWSSWSEAGGGAIWLSSFWASKPPRTVSQGISGKGPAAGGRELEETDHLWAADQNEVACPNSPVPQSAYPRGGSSQSTCKALPPSKLHQHRHSNLSRSRLRSSFDDWILCTLLTGSHRRQWWLFWLEIPKVLANYISSNNRR